MAESGSNTLHGMSTGGAGRTGVTLLTGGSGSTVRVRGGRRDVPSVLCSSRWKAITPADDSLLPTATSDQEAPDMVDAQVLTGAVLSPGSSAVSWGGELDLEVELIFSSLELLLCLRSTPSPQMVSARPPAPHGTSSFGFGLIQLSRGCLVTTPKREASGFGMPSRDLTGGNQSLLGRSVWFEWVPLCK